MLCLQGYSQDIAVSEKVWLGSPDKTTRFGIPWNFMLRDVLQYDSTLDDATNRMASSHRTCDVIFGTPAARPLPHPPSSRFRFAGVGTAADGQMRVYDYSAQELLVYDDKNYPLFSGHPRMDGLVYAKTPFFHCISVTFEQVCRQTCAGEATISLAFVSVERLEKWHKFQ
jgi:hypothetical protein